MVLTLMGSPEKVLDSAVQSGELPALPDGGGRCLDGERGGGRRERIGVRDASMGHFVIEEVDVFHSKRLQPFPVSPLQLEPLRDLQRLVCPASRRMPYRRRRPR